MPNNSQSLQKNRTLNTPFFCILLWTPTSRTGMWEVEDWNMSFADRNNLGLFKRDIIILDNVNKKKIIYIMKHGKTNPVNNICWRTVCSSSKILLREILFKTFIGGIYYCISFTGWKPCNMCLYKKKLPCNMSPSKA